MAGHAGDIEVVVLPVGDDGEEGEPDEVLDGRPRDGGRRRRWGAALVAAAVVVVTLVAPVARGRPEREIASPGMPATEPSRCPGPDTRRLWCAFVTDGACCPNGGEEEGQPSREAVD